MFNSIIIKIGMDGVLMILGWFKVWFLLGAVLFLPDFTNAVKEKKYKLAIAHFCSITLLCYLFWTNDLV
jgi:hypothetical protein